MPNTIGSLDNPIIEGVGPKNASLAIFGEAPGEDEIRYRKPFVGRSGQLLTEVLNACGLSRRDIYIDNVIQVRPPGNKLERLSELGMTKESFYEGAKNRLREARPDVCLLLGATALDCFLSLKPITKHRGSVYMWEGIKMLPSIHPANIVRGAHENLYLLEFDIQKAKSIFGIKKVYRNRKFIIDPTADEVLHHLDRLKNAEFLSIDIETRRGNTIDCFGLGDSEDFALCIPFLTSKGPRWDQEVEALIWTRIKEVLQSPSHKIMQNMMYELYFFYFYGLPVKNIWMDTMIAIHTIYPELKKALWNILSLYTYTTYHKDELRDAERDEDRWTYNCKDVAGTFEAAMGLHEDLIAQDLVHFFHNHVMRLVKPYISMSVKGIKVDYQKLEKLRGITIKERDYWQKELEKKIGYPFNVKSFKQMKEYFYEEKKLSPVIKKGRPTLDENALWFLSAKYPKMEELKDVIKVRNRRTFLELFLNKEFDWDGRLRYGFNPVGTITGRSSASASAFYTGLNPQQTPRSHGDPHMVWNDFQGAFLAEEGCSFVAADLAQAEARDVAFLCNDLVEKEMYANNQSVHIRNAMICSGLPAEECGKGSWAYDLGKMSKHQYNYSGGPIQFHRRVIKEYGKSETPLPEGFSVKMIKEIFAKFDRHTPLVKQVYHVDVKHQIKLNRMLFNPFGRRRFFMDSYGDELFRSAYATTPQSTVVDIIHRAMKWENIPANIPQHKLNYMILQKHDELVVHCRDEDILEVKKVMKEWMEVGIMIHGDEMVIPVEFSVSKCLE